MQNRTIIHTRPTDRLLVTGWHVHASHRQQRMHLTCDAAAVDEEEIGLLYCIRLPDCLIKLVHVGG